MNDWLAKATELIGERSPNALVARFVENIKHANNVVECILLIPSSDGRQLNAHDKILNFNWSVVDFDVPFAHVLQSQQAMILSAEDLVFWRSNRIFNQLADQVGLLDVLRVQPLPMEGQAVQSLLLLIGNERAVKDLFVNKEFSQYLQLFSKQWSLLSEMVQTEQTRLVMKQSLSDIAHSSTQHQHANQLAQTLIGNSQVMCKLREQIVSAANSTLSVMIQGETGTGKELVAQAIHRYSSRYAAPFVALNCAAIPEHLLESELFGYKKGAFSGAESDKQGLIAQADGGTLFLDEIGDMPLLLQAKLLRVLESRTYRPLGAKEELSSDFRLVSATHVNLQQRVHGKDFRQDLFYRLLQYPLQLPALAERIEDIELLSTYFIDQYNQQHSTHIRGVHYQVFDSLKQYHFPGNVRELKHLIEFGCAQTKDGTEIQLQCFNQRQYVFDQGESTIESQQPNEAIGGRDATTLSKSDSNLAIGDLKQALNEYEAKIIAERLTRFDGDRAKAAESLGIPKRTLAYKCLKLEIEA